MKTTKTKTNTKVQTPKSKKQKPKGRSQEPGARIQKAEDFPGGQGLRQVALRQDIRPDPNQPRQEFPADELKEFAGQLAVEGILDALLVRADPDRQAKWMLIDGERRWRAAALAGIDRLPITVRLMDDAAARRYQRISGTQRKNLTALEQADAFAKDFGMAPKGTKLEEFAKSQGLGRSTGYNRLALAEAAPCVREALKTGKIDAAVGVLVTTVPDPAKQAKVIQELTDEEGWRYPYSFREVQELIESDYRKSLKDAPFDQKAVYSGRYAVGKDGAGQELASVPPCATCRFRSGNLTEQFPELAKSPNVCTNPSCFKAKTEAHAAKVLAQATAEGAEVVPAATYAKAHYGQFRDAGAKCYEDAKQRTYAQLAKAADLKPMVAIDSSGAAKPVFSKAQVQTLLQANEISTSNSASHAAADKKARALKAKRDALATALRPRLQSGLEKNLDEAETLKFWAGWDSEFEEQADELYPETDLNQLTLAQLRVVAVATVLAMEGPPVTALGDWNEPYENACKLAGIDLKAEEAKAPLPTPEKEKKKK